jgi:C4-dicarboxylate transporter DctM subunit
MSAALLIALLAALFLLRQPLLIILLSVTAYVHLVWGQGDLTYIIDDMWRGIDKEVILAIRCSSCAAT